MLYPILFNRLHVEDVTWDDAAGKWSQAARNRIASNRRKVGNIWLTFVHAYVASVLDNCNHPKCGASCRTIRDTLEGARAADDHVPMSAYIHSFQHCPGRIIMSTLHLLHHAEHIGSFSMLQQYKHVFKRMVLACLAADEWDCRDPELQVYI
eukprot:jgi/Ulvmu1/9174/UM005_0273.1